MRLNLSKFEHCVKSLEHRLKTKSSWGTGVLIYKQTENDISEVNLTILNNKQSTNITEPNIKSLKQLNQWINSLNTNMLIIIKDDLSI